MSVTNASFEVVSSVPVLTPNAQVTQACALEYVKGGPLSSKSGKFSARPTPKGTPAGSTRTSPTAAAQAAASTSASSSGTVNAFFPSPTASVSAVLNKYPRSAGVVYSYGTSGFRGVHTILPSVTARMAVLAAIRALFHGQSTRGDFPVCPVSKKRLTVAIGIMVTASHNEEKDNGLKIIDADGGMLDSSWEKTADQLANAPEDTIMAVIHSISAAFKVNLFASSATLVPHVMIGRDSRSSSPSLSAILVETLKSLGAHVSDYGLVTTPQLHWLLNQYNQFRPSAPKHYYDTLAHSFQTLVRLSPASASSSNTVSPSLIDCGHGVGAYSLTRLSSQLSSVFAYELINSDWSNTSQLNDLCGAEHVQKSRDFPRNFSDDVKINKCASLDGDADRLVYFYRQTESKKLKLLDGDKLIVLYAFFIKDLLTTAGISFGSTSSSETVSIGVVQTAYANGASTHFISKSVALPIECTPTGVKHLHHAAARYDIGIYFESNGHGTILFSQHAKSLFSQSIKAAGAGTLTPKRKAAEMLVLLPSLINQCVGDGVSDLLLVELSLHHLKWTIEQWDALYEDLPSSMTKLKVKDRTAIKTYDAERKCSEPPGLQQAIDDAVAAAPNASTAASRRAFVRPSGTEDVVRIYAEAADQSELKDLVEAVTKAVSQFCA